MNELILTSFRDVSSWPSSTVWSVARWQPGYIGRPELPWLAPFDVETGRPLVHLMPAAYRLKYEAVLDLAESKLRAILSAPGERTTFCCWCHPDRQRGYPSLYCHTILIGYRVERLLPNIHVVYADGRDNPVWPREAK